MNGTLDSQIQRYAPGRTLPSYRHRPGHTPHPRTHPHGHSYGTPEITTGLALRPDNWLCHETYLFGVDLFNFGYWWEAHEYWEALWRLEEKGSAARLFLQGLILLAAALLKEEAGNEQGHRRLLARGLARLAEVGQRVGPVCMGLDLAALRAEQGRVPALYLQNPSQSASRQPA
ncbi:MAG: DUF309 domain-containing protein [Candidatus Latescibacteria bacterium]|nr:DUF309 domain-containing protein [Candidatus Latescibacterota bacterium]